MASKKRNTKLPTIKQLPSGAYHCKVQIGKDDNGKAVYLSITDYDYDVVVLRAAEAKADREEAKRDKAAGRENMSLREAMVKYINTKSRVLSPSTVKTYKVYLDNAFEDIQHVAVSDITQEVIQAAVNRAAARLAPKTVRNHHGFLSAVLGFYRPDLTLRTTLPQKIKSEIAIPTEDEIKRLVDASRGTPMEIPVILAACCGLRRSEISALTWKDVDFAKGTIRIKEALVYDDENELVEKTTKKTASTRTIRMFPIVEESLRIEKERTGGRGSRITIEPDHITHRFEHLLNRAGLPRYRFHDLRHYTVSVMLALNIPKFYIASYVGHSSERMVDTVYGHLMASKKTSIEDQMQDYFSGVFDLKRNENGNEN